MSWLELLEFVESLPADSATKAALAGDREGRRWTQQDHLLAYLVNLVILLIRVQWVAGRLQGKAPDLQVVEGPELESEPSEKDAQRARMLQEMARHRPRSPSDPPDLAAMNAALKARQGP
jgi:hypothetical protein